jgi:hypothetical protein
MKRLALYMEIPRHRYLSNEKRFKVISQWKKIKVIGGGRLAPRYRRSPASLCRVGLIAKTPFFRK